MNRIAELASVCGFSLPGKPTAEELDALAEIKADLELAEIIASWGPPADTDPMEALKKLRAKLEARYK